jgi:hypothetical protein
LAEVNVAAPQKNTMRAEQIASKGGRLPGVFAVAYG